MGLNISIYGPGSKEHPDWDATRYAGDRDFAALIGSELPIIQRGDLVDDLIVRPADFTIWKTVIASKVWPNEGRFEKMTSVLEENPDCWVHFGW